MRKMKACLNIFPTLLLFALFFTGCKKDKSESITTHTSSRVMQAKINGNLVVCDSTVFLDREYGGKIIGIYGYKHGPVSFHFSCPGTVGSYAVLSVHDDI